MSDQPGFFMPFQGDPEEIRKEQEKTRMALTAIRHGIDRMVDNLDKDDLTAFRWLMSQIGDHDHTKIANYFEGQASALLKYKFKVCPSCGVDHDEEMRDEMDASIEKEPVVFEQVPLLEEADSPFEENIFGSKSDELITYILKHDEVSQEWLRDVLQKYRPEPPKSALEREMMALYGLDDAWNGTPEDRGEFVGFVCKNCQKRYSSIQDRMLKPVDECQGCFLKAAHG